MINKKILLIYSLLFLLVSCSKRNIYVLTNEELLFSFNTEAGKTCSISVDKNVKYIVYRFGTENKVELEYPADLKSSWKLFKYESYLRGGGVLNEAMSLDSLSFINDGYEFRIYDEWYSVTDEASLGIIIISPNGTDLNIKGLVETKLGALMDLKNERYPIENNYEL